MSGSKLVSDQIPQRINNKQLLLSRFSTDQLVLDNGVAEIHDL